MEQAKRVYSNPFIDQVVCYAVLSERQASTGCRSGNGPCAVTSVIFFEFKHLFMLCGDDVVKAVLRDVDERHVFCAPVKKM